MLLGIKSTERGYNYPIIKARVILSFMLFTIVIISSIIRTIINNITNLIIYAIDLIQTISKSILIYIIIIIALTIALFIFTLAALEIANISFVLKLFIKVVLRKVTLLLIYIINIIKYILLRFIVSIAIGFIEGGFTFLLFSNTLNFLYKLIQISSIFNISIAYYSLSKSSTIVIVIKGEIKGKNNDTILIIYKSYIKLLTVCNKPYKEITRKS